MAVEVPNEVRERVAAAARELLLGVGGVKPVASEHMHLTVRFVGEVPESGAEELVGAVREAVPDVRVASAEVRGFGAFPDERRPRVVWAGIEDPAGVFAALETAISGRLLRLGHAREDRPFSAHLTVARMKERDPRRTPDLGPLPARLVAARQNPPAFGGFAVESVTVFRSELTRTGPHHTALARLPLSRT